MPIVLITGGSGGVGKEIARSVSKRGSDVVLAFRSNEPSSEFVNELKEAGVRVALLKVDVCDLAGHDEFVERFRETLQSWGATKFHHLVNNAGYAVNAVLAQASVQQMQDMLNVHLLGPFSLTQKLLPLIEDGGAIVNISTGLTRFSLPSYGPYAIAKAALETYTKYLAMELGGRRIRALAIAPGALDNDFNQLSDALRKHISGQTALGRVGQSSDIGKVVAFALSDDAGWITGQRIEVSGGVHL